MAEIHVAIAYDFDSDKTDGEAWEKFKDKYRPLLYHKEEIYPESTAVLKIIAENDEEAIQIVKAKIEKRINEIKADDTAILVSKFFIACCYNEEFYS